MMGDTLLIIEDNKQNLYLMRFLLEKNGFEVIEATNGKTGIDLALKHKPLGILLDIQRPEIDGCKVALELKKHDEVNNYRLEGGSFTFSSITN